ncbi:MAG: hypothetical protein ACP5TV_12265 [Anaerolineae bacterium]
MEQSAPIAAAPSRKRFIWLLIEPADIMELKQIVLDDDTAGAYSFFYRVIIPQVQQKISRLGGTGSTGFPSPEAKEPHHERLP